MPRRPQPADHRSYQDALKVAECREVHTGEHIKGAQQHLGPRHIPEHQTHTEYFAQNQRDADAHAENILNAEALMPQQLDIAHDHHQRKNQYQR